MTECAICGYSTTNPAYMALHRLGCEADTRGHTRVEFTVTSVLNEADRILDTDLDRARKQWYPINPDGTFNR